MPAKISTSGISKNPVIFGQENRTLTKKNVDAPPRLFLSGNIQVHKRAASPCMQWDNDLTERIIQFVSQLFVENRLFLYKRRSEILDLPSLVNDDLDNACTIRHDMVILHNLEFFAPQTVQFFCYQSWHQLSQCHGASLRFQLKWSKRGKSVRPMPSMLNCVGYLSVISRQYGTPCFSPIVIRITVFLSVTNMFVRRYWQTSADFLTVQFSYMWHSIEFAVMHVWSSWISSFSWWSGTLPWMLRSHIDTFLISIFLRLYSWTRHYFSWIDDFIRCLEVI